MVIDINEYSKNEYQKIFKLLNGGKYLHKSKREKLRNRALHCHRVIRFHSAKNQNVVRIPVKPDEGNSQSMNHYDFLSRWESTKKFLGFRFNFDPEK